MAQPTTTTTTTQRFFMPLLISAALLPLLFLLSFIVSLVLMYKLVKRRNTHFKRQSFLFEDIIAAVKAIAKKKGIDVTVEFSSFERTLREARAEETEKGAVLWAILSAIIILAQWYVYYFLMKDFYKHERREDGFWEDLRRTLDKCGVTFSIPRRTEATPDRSFVLYLILNIITLGLFGIYWIYVLLKDPNQHFRYHMQIEDQLLSTLESVAV
jgi:predicted permease